MKCLIYIAVFIALISCRTYKPLVITETVKGTINVTRTITPRDTIFKIDSTKVYVEVPVYKVTGKPIIRKHDNVRVIIKRVRDTLRITAVCDSLELRAKIRDEIVHEIRIKEVVKTEIIREQYVPFLIKVLAYIGVAALVFMGIKLIVKRMFI